MSKLKELEVAEKFALGDATREDLYAAAYAYTYDDGAYADNAYAVAYPYADNADDARKNVLKEAANICRKYIDFDDLGME